MRVGYPGDSSALFDLFTNDQGEKDGSTVEFFGMIQETMGYNIQVYNISDDSLARYTSSYTACTHDIGLGRLDLCVDVFYSTAEHEIISLVSTSFYPSVFYLFVPEKKRLPLRTMIWTPFKLFTYGA